MRPFRLSRRLMLAIAAVTVSTIRPGLAQSDYGTADCLMENCSPSQSGYLDG